MNAERMTMRREMHPRGCAAQIQVTGAREGERVWEREGERERERVVYLPKSSLLRNRESYVTLTLCMWFPICKTLGIQQCLAQRMF